MAAADEQPNIKTSAAGDIITPGFLALVTFTGAASGMVAGGLMKLLRFVQHFAWNYQDGSFLDAAARAPGLTRLAILTGAGLIAAMTLSAMKHVGQKQNSPGVEAAVWLNGGHLLPVSTTLKALLSIVIVGLGASLGREAAPKQMGALIGYMSSQWSRLSDRQESLLVACGAGAGIAAVYNVPFGGALFTLEVLLGELSLPLVVPAFIATLSGTTTGWLLLPNEPTYKVPTMPITAGLLAFAIVLAPVAGVASALFVKALALAGRLQPRSLTVLPVTVVVFALIGCAAMKFPQVLGNGKGIVELAILDKLAISTLLALLVLKPLATLACFGTGAPGGLFTPTIACGALLGAVVGHFWLLVWPGTPPAAFALLGLAAMLGATTKGPVSSIVLVSELTRHVDGLMVPLLAVTAVATFIAHRIDPRSTYTIR